MTRLRITPSLLAVSVAAASGAAFAQSAVTELQRVQVVSTASGYEQKITDAPASITVVSREDLEQKRYANLAEALEDVEGIDVRGNTGKTGGLNISIRGMPAEYTLILIDGRRQNTSGNIGPNGFGEYNTSFMPPMSAIERIEVVRGPMSTLYGSDAMGGVVNIITRKVGREWGGNFTQDYTLQEEREFGDTYSTSLYASGPLVDDTLGLTVRGGLTHRDESDLKATGVGNATGANLNTRGQNVVEARQYNVGARFDLTALDNNDLWLDFDLAKQKYDNGSPDDRKLSNNDTPTNWRGYDDTLRFNRHQIALGHDGNYGLVQTQSSLMYNYTETLGRTIPGNPSNPGNTGIPGKNVMDDRELENTNWVFDTKAMMGLGDSHFLTVGGQWWKAEMLDAMAGGDEFKQTTWSLFAEDEWRIVDSFALTLGARHDQHDAFGGHFSPRAYGVWSATPEVTLKGGVSGGYKTPQVNELHNGINGVSGQGTVATVGNPDLKPETSLSQELGLYYDAEDGFAFNVTVFHNEFKDKITGVAGRYNCNYDGSGTQPIPNPLPGDCYNLVGYDGQYEVSWQENVDKARTQGVELGSTFPLADTVSLGLNYTYTDSEIRKNGQNAGQLSDTPRHMAHARLNWQATPRVSLWTRVDYRGESRRFDGRTSDLNAANQALYNAVGDIKGYELVSVGGSFRVNPALTLNAGIYNALNKDFRKFTAYDYNGQTYYASQYSHFNRSTKGGVLEGRRLWVSANFTF